MTRIQLRRGTAAEWTSANPVLAEGEEGYETDTGRSKRGNGSDVWSDVPYGDHTAYRTCAGVVTDGVTDDRAALASSDTAAVSASLPLMLLPGTYRVATDLTISSPVWFTPGAILKPDNGVTVTLSGGVINSPLSQIFDHSAGGLVVPINVAAYHPAWWGDVGTSDDTDTWTAMAAALAESTETLYSGAVFGQRIIAPAGINRIHGVTLSNCELVASRGTTCFVPPSGTTSGSMLTLGDYAQLSGGFFATNEAGHAVTLIDAMGYRVRIDGVYVANQADDSTGVKLGDDGQSTTSPVITNSAVCSGLSTPASGSIGIDVQSSDMEASNVWVAQHDVGIQGSWGGNGRWTNVHVWGNGTGISGSSWDGHQFTNVYLDSNRGWGADIESGDRMYFSGLYVWANGAVTGSTGGVRLVKTAGSSQFCVGRGVYLNDNVGTGLHFNGGVDHDFEVFLQSSTVQGGGSVVTTTGVLIDSGCLRVKIKLRGTGATTPITDNSTSTFFGDFANDTHAATSKTTPVDADELPLVDSAASNGSKKLTWANLKATIKSYYDPVSATLTNKSISLGSNTVTMTAAQLSTALTDSDFHPGSYVVASSDLVVNNSTTGGTLMTMSLVASSTYLVRGAIVVDGNQAADCKIRLQATNSTGVTGWWSLTAPTATSSTSATNSGVTVVNNANIAASAGSFVAAGVITGTRSVIPIVGYVVTGTGASQSLDCHAAQNTADLSDTTFYAGSWLALTKVA